MKDISKYKNTLEGTSIVIIDDDEATRLSIAQLLEQFDAKVTGIDNGVDGLSYIRGIASGEREPSVVILDFNLPGLTGLDVVRSLEGASRSVPIILITGRSEYSSIFKAEKSINKVLFKPVDVSTLIKEISELVP